MSIKFYTSRRINSLSKAVLSHSAVLFPIFAQTVVVGFLFSLFSPLYAQERIIPPNAMSKSDAKAETKAETKLETKLETKAVNPETTIIKALLIHGQPEGDVHLNEQVEVTRGKAVFTSDMATYRQLEDQLEASGHVSLKRNGDCYNGDLMQFILETSAGFISRPTYSFAKTNGQGKAEKIEFADEEHATITKGTYSTCEGLSPDWYLKADTLSLDTGLDTAVAKKTVLYFKDVPIFATPEWMSFRFPLSGARHTGFLPPTIGNSNKGGIEFGMPYYYNIAPNRDLTILPKMIYRRGLQLGLEGRYLGDTYSGETAIEAIRDKLTDTTRYSVNSIHNQRLMPAMVFSWNLNKASDNDYPSDFSNNTNKTAQRLLSRDVGLDYYGAFWNASLHATSYQVLQDITAPISLPYERLPQLSFHAGQNDVNGLDWSFDALLTSFWHPTFVRGNRAVINPQISIPYVGAGFFVTPKVSLHATSYQLENTKGGQRDSLQRIVPSVSIDSGLIFERQTSLLGRNLTQTLEPRLFYVNTPFRDQKDFPLFDTALTDFNFGQIFSENRFTGHDRIGDSNQITAGLVSRFLEENGTERFKFAAGQRFYFNKQQVSLDGVSNPSRSDFLLAASGPLSETLTLEGAMQLSQSDRQLVRSSYGLHWQPAPKKIINLQSQFQRDVLRQLEFSGQWPVSYRWYAVGKMNYSLLNSKLVEGLVGLEYRADCWAFRFVGHRFATTNQSNNSGFSIQLELTGLAKIGFGANPIETLKKNISGYQATK